MVSRTVILPIKLVFSGQVVIVHNIFSDDPSSNPFDMKIIFKLSELCMVVSVTRKKLPNVYNSCPKLISPEKLKILTPLQKLPKYVGVLRKISFPKGFEKCPKVQ